MEQELNDYDRGNFDCQAGYPAQDGQSEAYYKAYGARYCYEQTVGGQHEIK
jgi:hypothetical protein